MSARCLQSRTKRSRRRPGLWHLAVDEDGAAYTLSYVMVIPVYALLICAIVELALLLTAKLGTVYASYAAVRSASVWSTATTWENAEKKARKAAIKCMTPFASGTQSIVSTANPTEDLEDDLGDIAVDGATYNLAYKLFATKPVSAKYLSTKYAYALRHIEVKVEEPTDGAGNITATVTYEFPFNIPGIGRIFGEKDLDGTYYLQDDVIGDHSQRRPARRPQERLASAMERSSKHHRRSAAVERSHARTVRTGHGKITMVTLIAILGLLVLAGFVGNAGHIVTEKVNTQNAADAMAFSSAQWMARGMNAVTATNHLLGEATAPGRGDRRPRRPGSGSRKWKPIRRKAKVTDEVNRTCRPG